MLHSVSIILSSGIVIFEKMWATDISNKVRFKCLSVCVIAIDR
jgi:hypothetical protein